MDDGLEEMFDNWPSMNRKWVWRGLVAVAFAVLCGVIYYVITIADALSVWTK